MDRRFAWVTSAGPSRIARVALMLALAASVAPLWLLSAGCGSSREGAVQAVRSTPMVAPTTSGPASAWGEVSSAGSSPAAVASPTDASSAATIAESRVVTAAAVVRRFCRLVDQHRYAAARCLLAGPEVWPLRELRAVRRLRFESAQAWGEPGKLEVTLLVAITAVATWRSPLTDGINDVFFTLTRRVTAGEWLIAAVSTSP
jgi:hypothetical protein